MQTKIESNEQYHSSKDISASGLKKIYQKSVYHYLNQKPFSSSSLDLGSAIHTVLLEPEIFKNEFYVMGKVDRRTKEGKKEYNKHLMAANGRKLLTQNEMNIIEPVKENFAKHDLAKEYCVGKIELSHYLKFLSVPVRVRPDVKGVNFISDIKTCQDNSPKAFKRDVYKYAYHLQAAFYSDALGFPAENFRFIAIETNYPYSIEVYSLSEDMIEQGRNAYKSAIESWILYLDTGVESGYKGLDYKEDGSIII